MHAGRSSSADSVTREQVRSLLWRSCWKKKPYPHQGPAQHAAARARATGADVAAYRCALTGGDHWHIGHALSWEGVMHYAAAMRWCWEHPDEVPRHVEPDDATLAAMGINRNDNPPANAVDVEDPEQPATAADTSDPDAVPAGYIPPADQITPTK